MILSPTPLKVSTANLLKIFHFSEPDLQFGQSKPFKKALLRKSFENKIAWEVV